MQVIRVSWVARIVCYFLVVIVTLAFVTMTTMELFSRWRSRGVRSVWVTKSNDNYCFTLKKISKLRKELYSKQHQTPAPFLSPYILPTGKDEPVTLYSQQLPKGSGIISKKIGFFDPLKENQSLLKTNFSACQYSKCKMSGAKESPDAMIFLIAKLKHVDSPRFKRSPKQYWVFKTDEAPSRFSWFEVLKKPGFRASMNWTLTHKSDSDVPVFYGKLSGKEILSDKDYSKIYDRKSKTAVWFVSHCPVRSRRGLYVEMMTNRIDVDIFGKCGTKTCGMGEKIPGVFGMRQKADKEECFPMMSSDYFFYLAFENSLCQEYITEKFFKLFHDVDIVPVVRGGADYKKYFPTNMFIDASDFSTPEALADFLHDLASDKDRYIEYLRNKNRYRYVEEHPHWQCKLCEKLHTDYGTKTYPDLHTWWTRDSCHDAMDSVSFY